MTDISSIPLNKLVDSPDNVRKTAGADGALHFNRRRSAGLLPLILPVLISSFGRSRKASCRHARLWCSATV